MHISSSVVRTARVYFDQGWGEKKKKPASPKIDATLKNVDNSMYLGKNSTFLSQLPCPSGQAAFGDSDSVFSYIVDGLTSEMMSHSQEMPLSIKGI